MQRQHGPAKAGHPVRRRPALVLLVLAAVSGAFCRADVDGDVAQTIVALERSALERWGKGDPQGFFDIMAPDQTYFDPTTAKRIDGQDELKDILRALHRQDQDRGG